jgi:hypothetical protein
MTRRPLIALLLVAATFALVGAGCGSSSNTKTSSAVTNAAAASNSGNNDVHFAKTKFLLHAGLAFGAFHHFLYKPFRAGQLNSHHKLKLVKAAAAGLFVYHEIKQAGAAAQGDPTLSKLTAPLAGLGTTMHSFASKAKDLHFDSGGVTSANDSISAIKQSAAQSGAPITEHTPASAP